MYGIGVIHYELLPSGQIISAEIYSVRLVFTKNKRLLQTEKVLYSIRTRRTSPFTMAVSTHSPYSPDLSLVFGHW